MTEIVLGVILSMGFAFIGFFLFEKNETTEKFFGDKQNTIYISIVFFIYGMYLSGDWQTRKILFEEQIGYALGVYLVALFGAMLATFIGMSFKFSFKNRKFFYSLNSAIIFSTIIYVIT
tara:strand:+ start:160 stop:516 length:357 start_codon:yes stop_codon:yes gene_type:complete